MATLWEGHLPASLPAQAFHFPHGGQAAVFEIASAASVPRELIHLRGKWGDQRLSTLSAALFHDWGHEISIGTAFPQLNPHLLVHCMLCLMYLPDSPNSDNMSEVAWTSHIFLNTGTDVLPVQQFKIKNFGQNPTKAYSRWSLLLLSTYNWWEIHSKAKQLEKGN